MIETKRLLIKPLTYDQLTKYIKCDNSLEAELNLNETSRTISPELKEALEQTILPNVADKTKNYLYSTLWTAILKAENKMIGDLCIIGEPNAQGEIEIGYGTYDEFQGRGLMTEMVGGIIEWVKTQPLVKSILASTNKSNIASFKVLQNNNFVRVGETETSINWKLQLNKRKLILYIAMSLDGYIAKPNDDLSFLSIVEKDGEDYGYANFVATVDTVIVGRKTYDWVTSQVDFPHADKDAYIITRTPRPGIGKTVFYTGDLTDLIKKLKDEPGKNIFCDGGAEIVNELLKSELIDELMISVIPILVGNGTRLFKDGRPEEQLELVSVKNYDTGLIQLHYNTKMK
jgi:[ribosomal protein S5]-alanine N-acetyltransferase